MRFLVASLADARVETSRWSMATATICVASLADARVETLGEACEVRRESAVASLADARVETVVL